MENKEINPSDMLSSLGETSKQITDFLNNVHKNLSPEQKEMINNEMNGNFSKKMEDAQAQLAQAMKQMNDFKATNLK